MFFSIQQVRLMREMADPQIDIHAWGQKKHDQQEYIKKTFF